MRTRILFLVWASVLSLASLGAVDRFPKPDFTSGYQYPALDLSLGEPQFWQYADVVLLAAALGLMGFLVRRGHSRRGVFLLSLASLGYFGFFRQGCVCPVGSIQTVSQALADSTLRISLWSFVLFLLPLAAALWKGRLFCGGVCALGNLQDLVSVGKRKVPEKLEAFLSFLPPVFLVLSVAAAATGSDFLICRFDPFVGFFRLTFSDLTAFAASASFLGLSMVVHRPYCRFLCPYGYLQKLLAPGAFRPMRVPPRDKACVDCRLCAGVCPQNSLRPPRNPGPLSRRDLGRFLLLTVLLVPVLGTSWLLGSGVGKQLAWIHPEVRLLSELQAPRPAQGLSLEAEAFLSGKETREVLEARVGGHLAAWNTAGSWGLSILTLVLFLGLFKPLRQTRQDEYAPEAGDCTVCGRCQSACPLSSAKVKGETSP